MSCLRRSSRGPPRTSRPARRRTLPPIRRHRRAVDLGIGAPAGRPRGRTGGRRQRPHPASDAPPPGRAWPDVPHVVRHRRHRHPRRRWAGAGGDARPPVGVATARRGSGPRRGSSRSLLTTGMQPIEPEALDLPRRSGRGSRPRAFGGQRRRRPAAGGCRAPGTPDLAWWRPWSSGHEPSRWTAGVRRASEACCRARWA